MRNPWKRGHPIPTDEQWMDQARNLLDLICRHPGIIHPLGGSPEVIASCRAQQPWMDRAWAEYCGTVGLLKEIFKP